MPTYYEIFGIDRNASLTKIKEAYRNLMKHHHPDLHENSEESTEQSQILNKAYAVLKDPVQRYEYDNLLMLQRNPVDPAEDISLDLSEEGLTVSEIPQYVCEGCGRHDASLRVTVFLWVVSLLFTWKRGWGRILCSRCRLKYGILWNIEVWCAGWWGIPFGPPHTVEALMKNSTGGIQPEENNATLLSALADDFFHQHRYLESYQALSASLKLRMSKSGLEFLKHLKQLILLDHPKGIAKIPQPPHPLFFHVPVITVLFVVSLWCMISFFSPFPEVPQSMTEQAPQSEPIAMNTLYSTFATELGIRLDLIDQSLQLCREARVNVTNHLLSSLPPNASQQASSSHSDAMVLDWTKFDDQFLRQQTENIRNAYEPVSPEIQKLSSIDSKDVVRVDKSMLDFSHDLHNKFNEMASIYFNCALIAYSTPLVKHYGAAQGNFPVHSVDDIRQLGQVPDLAMWMKKAQIDSSYRHLVDVVLKIQMEDGRYSVMFERLTMLRSLVHEDSSVLVTLRRKMEYFQNARMERDYDEIVEVYNQKIPSARAHVQEYNDYLTKYNDFVRTLSERDLGAALNGCLNQSVIFP
jgi:hypothetical protein